MAGVNRIEVHCWHVIYVCRMWCMLVYVGVCVGVCGCVYVVYVVFVVYVGVRGCLWVCVT